MVFNRSLWSLTFPLSIVTLVISCASVLKIRVVEPAAARLDNITYSRADTLIDKAILQQWVPDSTVAYNAPAEYEKWWKEVSDCARIRGNLSRISWWVSVTPHADGGFRCPIVSYCAGWSNWKKHYIYVGENRVHDERLVKHEMLHDLLGDRNISSPNHHPLFDKCKLNQR